MDTFEEMIQAVQDDLTLGDESSFMGLAVVKRALNRAKWKVEGLFRWPKLEDAKKVTIPEDAEYIDLPETWRPDSAWKLTVNGTDYGRPLTFKTYLYEKEESRPSGRDYMWARQWTRVFAYPEFDAGDIVSVWGIKNAAKLVSDGDTTIFSYSMPDVNEAIVMEAVKILKAKGEETQSGEMLSAEAKGMVVLAWNRIKQDGAVEEELQPMIDVPDLFPSSNGGRKDTNYGRF